MMKESYVDPGLNQYLSLGLQPSVSVILEARTTPVRLDGQDQAPTKQSSYDDLYQELIRLGVEKESITCLKGVGSIVVDLTPSLIKKIIVSPSLQAIRMNRVHRSIK